MSIIEKLKRLFSGASKPTFSESQILTVQRSAEKTLQAFNETLNTANQSKSRDVRESELQRAHDMLIELKNLAKNYPFLHLMNLNAVEASILAVEAETRALPYDDLSNTNMAVVSNSASHDSLMIKGKDVKSIERHSHDSHHLSSSDEQAALMCIQSCFRVVNESIEIARKSKNIETKISRLDVARNRLKEARRQAHLFSLDVDGFNEAEAEITRIEEAIKSGNPTEIPDITSKPRISTVEESLTKAVECWSSNQDIISGLEFNATMQLRTPLRVLEWHGRTHSDIDSPPPQVAKEMWEGFWIGKTKTFRELGIDIDEPSASTMASDIGQVIDSEYLPFLIAVRKAVEMQESIDGRIAQLRNMPMPKEWKDYVDRHGGIEKIIDYFFPLFVNTIPKTGASIASELLKLKLDTPNLIANTPDATLLGIKGIGEAKLNTLRDYCATIESNRDSTRLDNVRK